MPKPPPMPVTKKAGGPADRTVDRAEDEERRESLAVDDAGAVAAVDRQAVDGEPGQQHADVLDVVPVAELAQAAGEDDPSEVGVDRQAREIDRPAARVEH